MLKGERREMRLKAITGIVLTLLLIGMLTLAFNIQPVKASGTIYIRADGSVEGTTDISSVDNITYYFTHHIFDEIIVERSNIIVDGNGYALSGSSYLGVGFNLTSINNVTIQNTDIYGWRRGIYIYNSSFNNTVSGNLIADNLYQGVYIRNSSFNTVCGNQFTFHYIVSVMLWNSDFNTISGNNMTIGHPGIWLGNSSNNTISGNNITDGEAFGIRISGPIPDYPGLSCDNIVFGNKITNNGGAGIEFYQDSFNNIVCENDIRNNSIGIYLNASNNKIYHNNFVNNTIQASIENSRVNTWDDGYPSGGNCWSNYTGVDVKSGPNQDQLGSDGIGDTPHVIDANNTDHYPLMPPSQPTPVGGISIPVNKLSLLAPYIGLTILLAVAVISVGYVKKRKRNT